ncbi:MAG: hypothetical protein QGI83_12170 [Candidatus Latescibacteria bacterium]|nr:hypothetical protein [Candidatus Latescibacterota bacterium]
MAVIRMKWSQRHLVLLLLFGIHLGGGCWAWAEAPSPERIALEVLEPEEREGPVLDWPVAVGVVFPEGKLAEAPGGRVVDDLGYAVPFEAEVTGWWQPEKASVKWLLLRFVASTDRRYFFEPGQWGPEPQGEPLATTTGNGVHVSTGPLEVDLLNGKNQLFGEVWLHGEPCLKTFGPEHVLILEDGTGRWPCRLEGWRLDLEQASPARAVVKGTGHFLDREGERAAKLEVRYRFFRDECFVRITHTLTWMVKDTQVGAREWSLRLSPDVGRASTVRVGLSDYGSQSHEAPLGTGGRVAAIQAAADRFSLAVDGRDVASGEHLGGWIALQNVYGRGVGISLRHAWQMFPTAFTVRDRQLGIQLWPPDAGRMGFGPQDLMPEDFYNRSTEWNRYNWIDGEGHYIHEYSKNPYFLHTAEGAARTHELTVFFYDASSRRSIPELNSVTQHPVVIRQDPKWATRVPFMGFDIAPVDRERYPDIERALDQIGRMATGRWAQTHDYGLWRFGMMRWANPGGVLYRWFDGLQYDSQLIPWVLFLRGGGRHFYEEGETTARFAMDVATNHYNTRGYPTGYQAAAAGMPLPWKPLHMHKAMKVHFLAATYHLTGDERAREVMEEVIAGTKRAATADNRGNPETRRGWGRELYNMNVFWANAYEQTGDPEVEAFAREWLALAIDREYNPELRIFRSPEIYLYNGLILQHRLWGDDLQRTAMLGNLAELGYPGLEDGGIYGTEKAIACGWAHAQTGDRRFAEVGWDVARALADLVPDHHWGSPSVPSQRYYGHQLYRQFLLPILTGMSAASREGLGMEAPFVRRDTYVSLDADAEGAVQGRAYLRPNSGGDLDIRLSFVTRWRKPVPAVRISAFDAEGREVSAVAIDTATVPPIVNRFHSPKRAFRWTSLTIPEAREGATYELRVTSDNKVQDAVMALVLADAQVVHHLPESGLVDFYQNAGQYFAGARVFAKTVADTVRIDNRNGVCFSMRDAETGGVLFRSSMTDPQVTEHALGRDRMVMLVVPGRVDLMAFEGLSPYLSATRDGWFEP